VEDLYAPTDGNRELWQRPDAGPGRPIRLNKI
jgi:hypothetical protein